MWRGAMAVLALAAMPDSGSGQELGASFRVGVRVTGPSVSDESFSGRPQLVASVPDGWAWSVSGNEGDDERHAPALRGGREREAMAPIEVALTARVGRVSSDRTVTWMFVPL